MKSDIEKATRRYIKAEYAFRLGPHAYTDETQHQMIKAERALRKAVTGKRQLRNAAKALGVVREDEAQPRKRKKPKRG